MLSESPCNQDGLSRKHPAGISQKSICLVCRFGKDDTNMSEATHLYTA